MNILRPILYRRRGGHQTIPLQDEHSQLLPQVRGRLVPLALFPQGVEGRVVAIHGGRSLTRRLMDLGLIPNARVKVTHAHSPGPLVVEVKDSRIALGRGAAMKIMAEEVK